MPPTSIDLFPLHGVYAATVTPLTSTLAPDFDALPRLLDLLAGRGCHGVLVLGTTGEGPSLSAPERIAVVRAALQHRAAAQPHLQILAGTGCANLTETIELTRAAFDLGVDGVVTLPAFYYKGVTPQGLAEYFEHVVRAAVPGDGRLLVYHIPQTSGVGVPPETITQLRQRFPHQVYGMKDSQDELAHTQSVLRQFPGFALFAGSDSLMSVSLQCGAAGCITALANVLSPLNRAVWDAHQQGLSAPEAHARLVRARQLVKGLNGPAVQKAALTDLFGMPEWNVRPPLQPLGHADRERIVEGLAQLLTPLA